MVIDKNIKVVAFDFDGTLFHLNVDWQKLKEELGVANSGKSLGEVLQEYIEIQHPNLQKVTEVEIAAIGDSRLDDSTSNLLLKLSEQYKVSIFTRNSRHAVEKLLQGLKIGNELLIVGREDVNNIKPHPEGLESIASAFGCLNSEVLLVGDTYHDVEAARAIGATSVIVKNKQLQHSPVGDYNIESLTELTELLRGENNARHQA